MQAVGRNCKVTSSIPGSVRPLRRRTEVDRFTPYLASGNKLVRVATALACSVAMEDMFTMLAVDSITKQETLVPSPELLKKPDYKPSNRKYMLQSGMRAMWLKVREKNLIPYKNVKYGVRRLHLWVLRYYH